jgi:hypothetical protein
MNTLRRRRGRLIGHILRHNSLLKTVLEGEISGKNYRRRHRMKYIGQTMKDVKRKSYVGMKRLAENREVWRSAINQSFDGCPMIMLLSNLL